LIDENGNPFNNHATQVLDFIAREVPFTGSAPRSAAVYTGWKRIDFNH
jgi:hypothetical protein